MSKARNTILGVVLIAVATVLVVSASDPPSAASSSGPGAPPRAAASVLPPPPLNYVPDRGGASAGTPCGGAVLCVGPSGTFATVTAAISAAKNGDTIQVEAGTYAERLNVSGKQLTLLGGFAAGFCVRNPTANPTVIDGQQGGTTITLTNAGDSTIDGFTITGGKAELDADGNGRGSGIQVSDSGAVTIRNNLIEGNDDGQNFNTCNCATFGGGIDITSSVPGSSVAVTGNEIRHNRAIRGGAMSIGVPGLIEGNLVESNEGGGDHGGALYLGAQTLTIRGNLIRNNEVGDQAGYGWGGGAIFFGPGKPTPRALFESNRWVGNIAPSLGSGLFIDEDAKATIVGDVFHDNACGNGASALYVDGTGVVPTGSVAKLENVTMTNSTCPAGTRGSAIFTEGGSSISVTNSIITDNGGKVEIYVCTNCVKKLPKPPKSTISWSLVDGKTVHVRRGKGMLKGDAGFADVAADDFHLAPGSQAIDAADPKSPVGLEPEPNGGRRNIGAYGGSVEATPTP
jgi:hypothetical protein